MSTPFTTSCLHPIFCCPFVCYAVELVNTQVTLEGIEHGGFVIASSYVAQVFGCEHEPSLREGDLVTKNSWNAKVQDVQVRRTVSQAMYAMY